MYSDPVSRSRSYLQLFYSRYREADARAGRMKFLLIFR